MTQLSARTIGASLQCVWLSCACVRHVASSLLPWSPVYTIQPVVKPVWQPVVSCIQTFNPGLTTGCIVYTAGCQMFVQPGLTTGWTNSCSFSSVVKPGLTTCWTNSGCLFNMVVKPVVQLSNRLYNLVWQPVWQPAVSCKQTFNWLSNRLENRFDNWLDVCLHNTASCWQTVVSYERGISKQTVSAWVEVGSCDDCQQTVSAWVGRCSEAGHTLITHRRSHKLQCTLQLHSCVDVCLLLLLFNSLLFEDNLGKAAPERNPFWILLAQEMMGWQWHQLDHMQIICTSLQTDNLTGTSPLSFYSPDALPATQPTASKHYVLNCK